MYVVYINLLYFLSIFLFTYNKNLLSQKKYNCLLSVHQMTLVTYKYFCKFTVRARKCAKTCTI